MYDGATLTGVASTGADDEVGRVFRRIAYEDFERVDAFLFLASFLEAFVFFTS